MDEVKLELAKEEAVDAAHGVWHTHDVSPTKFLSVGFDLEEQQ